MSETLSQSPVSETEPTIAPTPAEATTEVVDDLLVEEVSIDGMCGVY